MAENDCAEFFSLNDLSGSSLETEMGTSTLCVSNKLKAAIFIIFILLNGFLLLATWVYLFRELRRKRKWTWKIRSTINVSTNFAGTQAVFFLILFNPALPTQLNLPFLFNFPPLSLSLFAAAVATVVINSMHLAGVQSRYRYLVFCLPMGVMIINAILKVDMWFVTTSSVRKMIMSTDHSETLRGYFKGIMIGIAVVGHLLLGTILPIVYYDDLWALNWLFSFYIFFMGMMAFSLAACLAGFIRYIIVRCEQSLVAVASDDLRLAIEKFHKNFWLMSVSVILLLPFLLFPIWMGVTATPSNPGLQGHFYFYYIYFQGFLTLSSAGVFWTQFQVHGSGSSSSPKASSGKVSGPSGNDSAQMQENTFSFGVEELKGSVRGQGQGVV